MQSIRLCGALWRTRVNVMLFLKWRSVV